MRYPRILAALRTAKWAALPSTIQAVHDALAAHMRSQNAGHIKVALPTPASPTPVPSSNVAVIPVMGIIGKNLSSLETMCGGCDVNAVQGQIEEALEDDSCTSILLAFDSPGGVVTGVPELAAFIRAASNEKPIYAFTDGQCCSAAYWLASATQGIFCTQTADVGSIGVYVALVDESEAWAKEGYKLELMKAGEFKAMGHPGKPLADGERALIQAGVDKVYGMFTADVLKGRGDVATATMQGQTFMGQDALTANLVDEISTGIDAVIAELSTTYAKTKPWG
jgi:signal peptide peptidase SppA